MPNNPRLLPDQSVLQAILSYDPETGALHWKARPREMFVNERSFKSFHTKYEGKPALTAVTKAGYQNGTLFCQIYLAHRVIWKLVTGEDADTIDHINGNKLDNAWRNLRNVTQADNCRNSARPKLNRSGTTGVKYDAESKKWVAFIRSGPKTLYLGRFVDKDKAIAARKAAERRLGFHPNHGRNP